MSKIQNVEETVDWLTAHVAQSLFCIKHHNHEIISWDIAKGHETGEQKKIWKQAIKLLSKKDIYIKGY